MDGRRDIEMEMLLSAYRDGELSPDERAVVEEALREDPGLQARLDDHAALSSWLQASVEKEADLVDFSGFADRVMAGLPPPVEERASAWSRFTVWLDETLTFHKWQAASALGAAVVLLVAGPLVWNATHKASDAGRMQGPLLAGGPGLSQVISVQTAEDTDAMLFKTESGTTVIYVQGN